MSEKSTGDPKNQGCGKYDWKTKWILGGGERYGFIIQRVTYTIRKCACDKENKPDCCERNCFSTKVKPTYIYSEAWPVYNGKIYQYFRNVHKPRGGDPQKAAIPNEYDWIRNEDEMKGCGEIQFVGKAFFYKTKNMDLLFNVYGYGQAGGARFGVAKGLQSRAGHSKPKGTTVTKKTLTATWRCCVKPYKHDVMFDI